MTAGFSLFACTSRPVNGVHYLSPDLSLACGTPLHELMKTLGGAVIAFAGFGIPALLAFTLYRRRAQLYSRATFASLGALYDGYSVERGRYAFESVVMLRKAGAVMIGNLITDAHAQLTAALLLLIVLTLCQQLLQPFAVGIWAALDALSMASLLATLSLSLMYLRWATPASQCAGLQEDDVPAGSVMTCGQVRLQAGAAETAVTVVLILIHAAVLLSFAAAYVRLLRIRQLRNRVRSALAKVSMNAAASASNAPKPHVGGVGAVEAAAARQIREIEAAVEALLEAERTSGAGARRQLGGSYCARCSSCCLQQRSSLLTNAAHAPRRSSTARRASTAAMEFVRRAVKPTSQTEAAAAIAAAEARISPASVTNAQRELLERRLRGHRDGHGWCGCVVSFISRRICRPFELLDEGLTAACEASEATTARIFGPAVASGESAVHAAVGAAVSRTATAAMALSQPRSVPAAIVGGGEVGWIAAGARPRARFSAVVAAVAARGSEIVDQTALLNGSGEASSQSHAAVHELPGTCSGGSGGGGDAGASAHQAAIRVRSNQNAMALLTFRGRTLPVVGVVAASTASATSSTTSSATSSSIHRCSSSSFGGSGGSNGDGGNGGSDAAASPRSSAHPSVASLQHDALVTGRTSEDVL